MVHPRFLSYRTQFTSTMEETMKRSTFKSALTLIFAFVVLLPAAGEAFAQKARFKPREGTAIEVWRITHDATVRDTANYHNTQCWSHNGRYICYTRYAANKKEFGTRPAAEIHLRPVQIILGFVQPPESLPDLSQHSHG